MCSFVKYLGYPFITVVIALGDNESDEGPLGFGNIDMVVNLTIPQVKNSQNCIHLSILNSLPILKR